MNFTKISFLMLAGVAALGLTGCFNFSPQARTLSSTSSIPDDQKYDLTPISLSAGTSVSTTQILNFRGVPTTYQSLTGSKLSDLITGDPNVASDLSTYSLDSQPTSITSSMLLNQVRLAAGLCLALVKRERNMAASARRFFNSLDFTQASTAQSFDVGIKDAASRVSKLMCGRDADSATQTMVKNEISASLPTDSSGAITDSASGGFYANVTDGAVMVCSSFLASACTLTNN